MVGQLPEDIFQATFALAPEAMLLFDDEGVLLGANAASEALFGVPAAELVGKNLDLLGPSVGYDFRPGIRGLIEAGRNRGELRMTRGNGQPFDAEYQSRANVRPGVHATIVRDISDRKRIDAATKASEELFARAFINAPVAMAMTSAKTGRCVLANEAFFNLTGYWRSEVIGSANLFEKLWADAEERERVANAGGVPMPAEWIRRDGSRCRVLASVGTAEIEGSESVVLAAFVVE